MRNAVHPSTRQRASSMRVCIPRRLNGDGAVPTAAEVAQQVGGTVGLAMHVLDEFPGDWERAQPRRAPSMRSTTGASL